MNKIYIAIFTFFALTIHAQETEDWTKDLQPQHTRVSGTNAYLILDQPGWAPLPTNPNLILNEEQKAYIFFEQKKVSLEEYETQWMPIFLGDMNPEWSRQIRFRDQEGKVIKTFLQSERGEEVLWLVYIGDQHRMLDIKAAYAKEKDDVLEREVLTLLRSMFMDEHAVIRLFETVPFSADVEKHGFVDEASYMANSLMITNPETFQSLWIVLTDMMDTREEVLAQERQYLLDQEAEILKQESLTNLHPTEMTVYRTPENTDGICTYNATIFMDNQVITVTTNMENTPENESMFREIVSSVRLK